MDQLRALRDTPIEQVWTAIEELRAQGGPVPAAPQVDLLRAEWDLLSHPTTQRQDDDFRAVPTGCSPALSDDTRPIFRGQRSGILRGDHN